MTRTTTRIYYISAEKIEEVLKDYLSKKDCIVDSVEFEIRNRKFGNNDRIYFAGANGVSSRVDKQSNITKNTINEYHLSAAEVTDILIDYFAENGIKAEKIEFEIQAKMYYHPRLLGGKATMKEFKET